MTSLMLMIGLIFLVPFAIPVLVALIFVIRVVIEYGLIFISDAARWLTAK